MAIRLSQTHLHRLHLVEFEELNVGVGKCGGEINNPNVAFSGREVDSLQLRGKLDERVGVSGDLDGQGLNLPMNLVLGNMRGVGQRMIQLVSKGGRRLIKKGSESRLVC